MRAGARLVHMSGRRASSGGIRTVDRANTSSITDGRVADPKPVEGFTLIGDVAVAFMQVLLANELRAERRGCPSPVSVAEVQLLVALDAVGLFPDLQAPVGRYDLDFFFPDICLCIEVDGQQHLDELTRDVIRDRVLREQGIDTLRIWARDVFADATRAPPGSPASFAVVVRATSTRCHGSARAGRPRRRSLRPSGELYRSRIRAQAEEWVARWEREHEAVECVPSDIESV